jgi:hypothetical protein
MRKIAIIAIAIVALSGCATLTGMARKLDPCLDAKDLQKFAQCARVPVEDEAVRQAWKLYQEKGSEALEQLAAAVIAARGLN